MSIQHKILFGYFISVAVIGSMVAFLFHERNRVREIKNETLEVWHLQHGMNTIHRHITILSTYGETAAQAESTVHMLNWAIRSVKFLGVEFD